MIELFNNEDILDRNRIYELLFGIDTKQETFYNRPFSKFKHDILEQLRTEYVTPSGSKS